MSFERDHATSRADQLGTKEREVTNVGADIHKSLTRAKRLLQPAGDGCLPETVKQEPWAKEGVGGVNQQLGSPPSGDEGSVIPEIYGTVWPSSLAERGKLPLDDV
jgi:hypothetical protein